ncbi:MAG: hypothetical protein V4725_16090 [Bacteroidota bacterium]
MKNPIFDRKHLKEYIVYGALGSFVFMMPVLYFLSQNKYANLYYLFIGCILFMSVIFLYNFKLLNRPYDKKRAVSMLLASLMAVLTGVVISAILIVIAFLIFFPDLFTTMQTDEIMANAPAQAEATKPSGLLVMVLAVNFLGNFSTGAFISVITTYAGKKDQTRDKPAPLEPTIRTESNK